MPAAESFTPPPELPGQFLLWIDGVGGFLVCLNPRVTLGQANPETRVDVALMADISRHHAALQRDPEGYFLETTRMVAVNNRTTEKVSLRSSDRITLGKTCQLQFWLPVPVSASARLDPVSGHRFVLPVQAALLMAETLVLGPGPQSHVTVPDLHQPIILVRNKGVLSVKHAGPMTVDGVAHHGRGPLTAASTITTDQTALTLDPVIAPRR